MLISFLHSWSRKRNCRNCAMKNCVNCGQMNRMNAMNCGRACNWNRMNYETLYNKDGENYRNIYKLNWSKICTWGGSRICNWEWSSYRMNHKMTSVSGYWMRADRICNHRNLNRKNNKNKKVTSFSP